MKKSLLLASLLAAAALPSAAQAQDKPTPPPGAHGPARFASGGMPPGQRPMKPITREEALKRAADQFDAADANKDGVVTPEEFRAAMEKRQAERMARRGQPGGPDDTPPDAPRK